MLHKRRAGGGYTTRLGSLRNQVEVKCAQAAAHTRMNQIQVLREAEPQYPEASRARMHLSRKPLPQDQVPFDNSTALLEEGLLLLARPNPPVPAPPLSAYVVPRPLLRHRSRRRPPAPASDGGRAPGGGMPPAPPPRPCGGRQAATSCKYGKYGMHAGRQHISIAERRAS